MTYQSLDTIQNTLGFDTVYNQGMIDGIAYHKTIKLLRCFFEAKGFIEAPVQPRFSILAACEDPKTIECYAFKNVTWPLPQTGQMWLEYELLTHPDVQGYYCITTSYRSEPNPVPGRHHLIFPMFEFESKGDYEGLKKLEKELIVFLKLANNEADVPEGKYKEVAAKYGVEELDNAEEEKLYQDYGNAFLLTDFPEFTSPFFNIKKMPGEDAKKVDVILCGQESIGSAERATDVQIMRDMFHSISDGQYAAQLYELFGKERVNKELESYLSLDFFDRFGGGIGVTRLMSALKRNSLI